MVLVRIFQRTRNNRIYTSTREELLHWVTQREAEYWWLPGDWDKYQLSWEQIEISEWERPMREPQFKKWPERSWRVASIVLSPRRKNLESHARTNNSYKKVPPVQEGSRVNTHKLPPSFPSSLSLPPPAVNFTDIKQKNKAMTLWCINCNACIIYIPCCYVKMTWQASSRQEKLDLADVCRVLSIIEDKSWGGYCYIFLWKLRGRQMLLLSALWLFNEIVQSRTLAQQMIQPSTRVAVSSPSHQDRLLIRMPRG